MAYQPTPITPSKLEVKTGGYIFLVSGLGGVGKTSFAINSQAVDVPLYFANFDRDASHLLAKYKGDLMYLETFRRADTKPGALGELKRFRQFVDFARQEKQGVFIIDNVAAAWNIISKAYLPDEDRPAPKEYADANGFMRSLLLDMEDSNLTTVLTAPVREQWISASKTNGLVEPDVWKHLQFHSVAEIYLFRTGKVTAIAPIPTEELTQGQYKGLIMEAKLLPVVIGTVLDNPTMSSVVEAVL